MCTIFQCGSNHAHVDFSLQNTLCFFHGQHRHPSGTMVYRGIAILLSYRNVRLLLPRDVRALGFHWEFSHAFLYILQEEACRHVAIVNSSNEMTNGGKSCVLEHGDERKPSSLPQVIGFMDFPAHSERINQLTLPTHSACISLSMKSCGPNNAAGDGHPSVGFRRATPSSAGDASQLVATVVFEEQFSFQSKKIPTQVGVLFLLAS